VDRGALERIIGVTIAQNMAHLLDGIVKDGAVLSQ
jgi:hypothetical protein